MGEPPGSRTTLPLGWSQARRDGATGNAEPHGGILPERMWMSFAGVLHQRLVFDEISPPSHVFHRAISFAARDLCALRHRPCGP